MGAEGGGAAPLRVLVLGGSGFVGGAAVRALGRRGAEVGTFHRSGSATIPGDRADLPAHREAFARFAPDVVLDTIAYTERDAAALVAVARGLARRVVVVSSQDVYAAYGRLLGLEPGAPDPAAATEDSPLRASRFPYRARAKPGDMAYDYDKILVEQAAASDAALPATILRLPCVYGAGDPHRRVGQILDRVREGEPLLLDRTKAGWRWTRGAVENVGESIALAVADERASGRTYNLGEESALTEEAWTKNVLAAAGRTIEIRAVPFEQLPPGAVEPYDFRHDLAADTGRIRRELGASEIVSREAALAEAVARERSHPA
jgi:nucleoside-diphosphate-sugar epimerase